MPKEIKIETLKAVKKDKIFNCKKHGEIGKHFVTIDFKKEELKACNGFKCFDCYKEALKSVENLV